MEWSETKTGGEGGHPQGGPILQGGGCREPRRGAVNGIVEF